MYLWLSYKVLSFGNKNKYIYFVFHSLIRTFAARNKRIAKQNEKILDDSDGWLCHDSTGSDRQA